MVDNMEYKVKRVCPSCNLKKYFKVWKSGYICVTCIKKNKTTIVTNGSMDIIDKFTDELESLLQLKKENKKKIESLNLKDDTENKDKIEINKFENDESEINESNISETIMLEGVKEYVNKLDVNDTCIGKSNKNIKNEELNDKQKNNCRSQLINQKKKYKFYLFCL